MKRLAVFASGRGSNFSALLQAQKEGRLKAEFVALVSDQTDAGAIETAKKHSVPTIVVPSLPKARPDQSLDERRREHEEKILEKLLPLRPDFLVMAGYMRVVTDTLLAPFRSERGYYRVVNVHPSLLPAFPGVAAYRQAYEYGVHATGVTVHLVDEKLDSGPICAQETFSIRDCQSYEEVEKRGLAIEHKLYPETLNWILKEDFKIEYRGAAKRPCVKT